MLQMRKFQCECMLDSSEIWTKTTHYGKYFWEVQLIIPQIKCSVFDWNTLNICEWLRHIFKEIVCYPNMLKFNQFFRTIILNKSINLIDMLAVQVFCTRNVKFPKYWPNCCNILMAVSAARTLIYWLVSSKDRNP